ncbi:MAG: hypothetical protein ACJ8GO_02640 [Ramlibacter sp.]
MKKTVLLLAAVAGLSALGGCVGFVPVPVGPGYHGGYYSAPPRAYRDRDGDGVPNRYDRRPNNPYRY